MNTCKCDQGRNPPCTCAEGWNPLLALWRRICLFFVDPEFDRQMAELDARVQWTPYE